MKRQCDLVFYIICLTTLFMTGSFILTEYMINGSFDVVGLKNAWAASPAVTITPREIDLGLLSAGKTRKGIVTMRNNGSESVSWSMAAPEGWTASDQENLSGFLGNEPVELRIQLTLLKDEFSNQKGRPRKSPLPVQLTLEAGDQTMTLRKNIETGGHREMVRLKLNGGTGLFSLSFKLVEKNTEPLISIDPVRIDFGVAVQGEQVSRRIRVTNQGWNTLKWHAIPGEKADRDKVAAIRGKHVSFLNEEVLGTRHYVAPRYLKERLELRGKWTEEQGYPSAPEEGGTLRYRFSGTGISVYFRKGPDTGQLAVFLDDKFLYQQEGLTENAEKAEFLVAEGLHNGPHTLALVNRNSAVTIEGIRVYGNDVMKLNAANIALSPGEGVLTRQTNYVNIMIDTRQLSPGQYGDFVAFDSNGGHADVELALDVIQDSIPKVLDVYRYVRDADYFFTTNPQAELSTLQTRGYQKQGVAFRLFCPGIPGTTEFYRWFNPQREDHYYGYDLKIAKRSMRGYILEGTIGNIATSRLTFTRALYRWYHPARKRYFFTVDPNGEGIQKKGYQFDGIAGYVRP
jgi:hypothetical protein